MQDVDFSVMQGRQSVQGMRVAKSVQVIQGAGNNGTTRLLVSHGDKLFM
jgi:hypothetical protein